MNVPWALRRKQSCVTLNTTSGSHKQANKCTCVGLLRVVFPDPTKPSAPPEVLQKPRSRWQQEAALRSTGTFDLSRYGSRTLAANSQTPNKLLSIRLSSGVPQDDKLSRSSKAGDSPTSGQRSPSLLISVTAKTSGEYLHSSSSFQSFASRSSVGHQRQVPSFRGIFQQLRANALRIRNKQTSAADGKKVTKQPTAQLLFSDPAAEATRKHRSERDAGGRAVSDQLLSKSNLVVSLAKDTTEAFLRDLARERLKKSVSRRSSLASRTSELSQGGTADAVVSPTHFLLVCQHL